MSGKTSVVVMGVVSAILILVAYLVGLDFGHDLAMDKVSSGNSQESQEQYLEQDQKKCEAKKKFADIGTPVTPEMVMSSVPEKVCSTPC